MDEAGLKVLITGGAGFIGSHVADVFMQQGYDVVVVDNLSTGRRSNLDCRTPFLEMDICEPEFQILCADFCPDIIVHLAAQPNVMKSFLKANETMHVNVDGTFAVAQAAITSKVKRVLFSSTSAAYGEPDLRELPLTETTKVNPASPYGESKVIGENILRSMLGEVGIDCCIFRFSNVYGPRQDPSGELGVVALFCESLLCGGPLHVFGSGEQTRDYVYVKDLVRAIAAAAEYKGVLSAWPNKSVGAGIYHLSTGVQTTVNELVALLGAVSGVEGAVVHEDERPGEVFASSLDSTKAQRILSWEPATTINKGLTLSWQWYSSAVM